MSSLRRRLAARRSTPATSLLPHQKPIGQILVSLEAVLAQLLGHELCQVLDPVEILQLVGNAGLLRNLAEPLQL